MRRALALGVATACMTALMVVQAAAPVAAYPSSNVVIAGHGWGHGRGMGQYGALGYALRGAPFTDILQHFYSNTTPGTVANDPITVQLTRFDGVDGLVQQEKGHLVITNGPKAPAVAARSYALAGNRHPGWLPATKTCDTTSCQVYGGNSLFDGSFHALEDARTDQAVQTTAGQVRMLNGAVARTEFSS